MQRKLASRGKGLQAGTPSLLGTANAKQNYFHISADTCTKCSCGVVTPFHSWRKTILHSIKIFIFQLDIQTGPCYACTCVPANGWQIADIILLRCMPAGHWSRQMPSLGLTAMCGAALPPCCTLPAGNSPSRASPHANGCSYGEGQTA